MKTKFKSKLLGVLLVLAMLLTLGIGLQNSLVLKVYATDNYLAGSELKIETIIGGKHSTTFAGGKYLHLDPIDKNHYTNNVSANADMEYDETTGVLKIFDTENTHNNFRKYISIIATNTTDKKLTIKVYGVIYLYVLDFPHGDLTITNGEGVHNARLCWDNKLVITGKLTICGDIECNVAPSTNPGLYSESTSWISADELELLDSASLWVYSSYNTYTCGVNVRYLTLNTDGYLYINANRNTNNSFTYVLYVAYQVNFTKCLYISLSSPLDTVASLTNSTYLKNAVDTAPIEGYDAVINRVKTGNYGDYGEDLYRKEYDLSRLFNVTYNSNGGTGTMNSEDVRYNGKLTLPACTFTAPAGQQFAGWAVGSADATPLRTPTSYIQIKEPTVIYAVWENIPVTKYDVVYGIGEGQGSGSSESVDEGTEITLASYETIGMVAPDGQIFDYWSIRIGTAQSAETAQKQAGDKITINADTYIIAIWEDAPITNYTITATAGANGSISPSGGVTVAEGEDKTFTITANSGYHIKDVKVNGSSVGAVSTYTFTDVAANATITVEFEVDTVSHICNPTLVPEDEPDCTTAGKSAYYHCECGKNYEDAQGNTEIENIETWGILNALGHNPSTAWSTDGEYHFKECTRCAGQQLEKAAHSGGTATCTEKAVCATCNTAYGNTVAHSHGSEWKTDEGEHWNECACGDKANKAAHTDSNNDGKCDTCEYQMSTTPDNPNNTPDNPNNTPGDPSDDKDGLGTGAIVGIVIGSALVAGVGGFALLWFVIKKKSFADLIAVFKKK